MLLVEGGGNASRSNLETRCCRQEEQLHGVDLALAMHDWRDHLSTDLGHTAAAAAGRSLTPSPFGPHYWKAWMLLGFSWESGSQLSKGRKKSF